MFDVKNHALMSLDDLHTVKCHIHDTRKCLRDWDFVWARLDPDIRRVLTGKVEVEMFFKLIKDAPQHEPHFRDWDVIIEHDEPEKYAYMHSMTYLRRIITT
mgnify:FL=1